jgi:nicotinate-nucleotide adenylyltransferase
MRIGLLGGSFNPAHEGHLHISNAAIRALRLDYVWWLVSPQNPLKPEAGMAPLIQRVDAARAFTRSRRIVVTDIEAAFGTRYTADTLEKLIKRFSGPRFIWLMGSDNLLQIPLWRDWSSIFHRVPVAVVERPGSALRARCGKAVCIFKGDYATPDWAFPSRSAPVWTMIETRRSDASATELRTRSGGSR